MTPEPRRWLELSVRSTAGGESTSLLADALVALGGRAVVEREGWYVTHLTEPPDPERFRADASARLIALTGLTDLEVRTGWRLHEDWAETWKRGLAPRRLTERLVVTPSWRDARARDGDIVIVVDPGMAFGTAEHGTTRGCLRLLDTAMVPGDRVIDVGAGSGILSITSAKLGAADVLAIEGDSLAFEVLERNVAANGVAERVRCRSGWADADSLALLEPSDGVVANLRSEVHRSLLPGYRAVVREGGWLILSGILAQEWPGMDETVRTAGFDLVDVDADEDWRSGWFRVG